MSRKVLLRVAAGLVLFTALGHTFGAFAPPPADARIHATLKAMTETLMPMPVGAPKSFLAVMNGLSFTTSVYLLVAGLCLIILSNHKPVGADNAILLVTSVGLILGAILAAVYFFPAPALCMGLGGAFGLLALRLE